MSNSAGFLSQKQAHTAMDEITAEMAAQKLYYEQLDAQRIMANDKLSSQIRQLQSQLTIAKKAHNKK
jgi:LPS O-antigen subunit length determinant protein (WzzB/FepE family)